MLYPHFHKMTFYDFNIVNTFQFQFGHDHPGVTIFLGILFGYKNGLGMIGIISILMVMISYFKFGLMVTRMGEGCKGCNKGCENCFFNIFNVCLDDRDDEVPNVGDDCEDCKEELPSNVLGKEGGRNMDPGIPRL